ncbi:MAG: hypothetical protein QM820_35770 [Minicystis sp.]
MSDVLTFRATTLVEGEQRSAPIVARGPAELLDRTAADTLAQVAWDGPAPDPDKLDAATFLGWL